MQAVSQFLAELEQFDDQDLLEEHSISFAEPDTPAKLAEVDARFPIPCPAELKTQLASNGAFASDNFADVWNTLTLFSCQELLAHPTGLVDFINTVWGGRPELAHSLTADEIERLNAGFAVCGYRYVDDNCHDYFVFDRRGQFGNLLFNQDDAGTNITNLQNLAEAGELDDAASLADLIERQLAEVMTELEA